MIQLSEPYSLYDLAFNYIGGLEKSSKADILRMTNYKELAILLNEALQHEAYELCAEIKAILGERGEQLTEYE